MPTKVRTKKEGSKMAHHRRKGGKLIIGVELEKENIPCSQMVLKIKEQVEPSSVESMPYLKKKICLVTRN